MRRLATIVSALATAAATLVVTAPPAAAADPRLQGRFSTTMTVTASTNAEPVGRSYTRVVTFTPQCASGPCKTQLTRKRGDGKTISYMLTRLDGKYVGQKTYLAHCRLSSGYLVRDAYSYTEKLTLTPGTVVAGRTHTYTAAMTLSFSPNAKGRTWRCRAGSQRMRWEGTWEELFRPTITDVVPASGSTVPGAPLQVGFTPRRSTYTDKPITSAVLTLTPSSGAVRTRTLTASPWSHSFASVPPGATTLRIRVTDSAGRWRETVHSFTVAPPSG